MRLLYLSLFWLAGICLGIWAGSLWIAVPIVAGCALIALMLRRGRMVLLMLFVLELLFYTWCRVQFVNIGYQLNEETRRHQQLLKLQSNLKIELALLKSPARIAEIARTRLGLKIPDAKQTIVLP